MVTLLRGLGSFLRSRARAEDIMGRYGGEKFIVTMPNCTLEKIRQKAEEIGEGIKNIGQKLHEHAGHETCGPADGRPGRS